MNAMANAPRNVIGRESERCNLLDFVDKCEESRCGRTKYVCGSPGVGKTVCVQNVVESWVRGQKSQTIRKYDYRNVIGLHDHLKVFVALENLIKGTSYASQIRKKRQRGSDDIGESFAHVADCVDSVIAAARDSCTKPTTCVFVLDEIDYLCPSLSAVTRGGACKASLSAKRQLELISSLFSLPRKLEGTNCCLIIIGIANSIDLSAKLAVGRSREPLIDSTLIFRPYSAGELAAIVNVVSENQLDAISVEICSRKVAALHGDCRKVIDLCKQAKSNRTADVFEEGVAGVKDLLHVMDKAYRSQAESCVTLKALPIQQLLVLVAACRFAMAHEERTEFSLVELKTELSSMARNQNIPTDFVGPMTSLMERLHALSHSGLVTLKAASKTKPVTWRLNAPPEQLEATLKQTSQVVASALVSLGE